MIAGPLVVVIAPANPWALYLLLLITLVGFPAVWPFVIKAALQRLYRRNIIRASPTAQGPTNAATAVDAAEIRSHAASRRVGSAASTPASKVRELGVT
jgi:hypothetical protein